MVLRLCAFKRRRPVGTLVSGRALVAAEASSTGTPSLPFASRLDHRPANVVMGMMAMQRRKRGAIIMVASCTHPKVLVRPAADRSDKSGGD